MGLLRDGAIAAVGYGIRSIQDKNKQKKDYKDLRAEDIKRLNLRAYLDDYRNVHHIQMNTNDMDMFIFELKNIVSDYELGV